MPELLVVVLLIRSLSFADPMSEREPEEE